MRLALLCEMYGVPGDCSATGYCKIQRFATLVLKRLQSGEGPERDRCIFTLLRVRASHHFRYSWEFDSWVLFCEGLECLEIGMPPGIVKNNT